MEKAGEILSLNQAIPLKRTLKSDWLRVVCTKSEEEAFFKTWGFIGLNFLI